MTKAEQYRAQAAKAREDAAKAISVVIRESFLKIADQYEAMADHSEKKSA